MTKVARYIIILDRMDDDEAVGPDGHWPVTDEEGMEQVAAELQEAMAEMGEPAGFFRVVARAEVEHDTAIHTVTPPEVAHRAAMQVLDSTRTY
jgi:hypothetical protein